MMKNAKNRAIDNLNNAVEDLEEVLGLLDYDEEWGEAGKALSLIEELKALTQKVGEIVYR
jgi:hypothetical protein